MPLLTKRAYQCPSCGKKHGDWISILKKQTRKRCDQCSRGDISTDHRVVR